MSVGSCRFCAAPLGRTFVDLGMSPLCESYLSSHQLNRMEPFYPLHVYVCERCLLVQVQEYVDPGTLFTDYAYFSSYSDSWLQHARRYTEMAIDRFKLDGQSSVIEVASNDGYLLQYFVEKHIPVLGIEPAANVATVARRKEVPTISVFFGQDIALGLAIAGKQADLLIGNNVLAQVPDLRDFVSGLKTILKPGGTVTIEIPHLLRLIDGNQFDTIYHEHFSYFTLFTAEAIFAAQALTVFDVEELATHGGSLRLYARHAEDTARPVSPRVAALKAREARAGLTVVDGYTDFGERVKETKRKLLEFLITAKRAGKSIVGYGAPGKGNTLLNYCGIRTDFLDYTVDRSPHKQGKFLPGTHIPIHKPTRIRETRPDYVLILPWNLQDEIIDQHSYVLDWGGRFVVPIPEVQVFPE
jgi:SAM-dependent methyltransferase